MLLPVSLLTVSNSLILVNCEKCILNFTYTFKGYACYIFTGFFVCLKESIFETRKNAFYFTSKALLVLDTINFEHITYSVSWCHQMPKYETRNILNNLGSKHHLLIKFGQFMQYYKIFFFSKNSTKNVARKLVPGPF